MPRTADPEIRAKLLAAATRVLATGGRSALSTRRLAAEVGTSTMAVYTHFGSMESLQHEIRREGFARTCAQLDAVPSTSDPVADLAALILRYFDFGTAEPQLYRAMFADRTPTDEQDEGSEVFTRVLARLERCIADGRFAANEPTLAHLWAAQLWMAAHGMLIFGQAGMLADEAHRFLVADMIFRLAVGYGDERSTAEESVHSGTKRAT